LNPILSMASFIETYWKFLLIFAVYWQIIIILKQYGILKRFNISNHGPLLMIRTTRGQEFLDKLAKSKSFWRLFTDVSIPLMLIGMLLMFGLIIFFDISTLISLHEETMPPPTELHKLKNIFLLPGINDFIPLVWGLIGLIVTLVVHEFSHAILCKVEDIRVKSMGLIFMLIPIGGFAEPDENQLFERSEQNEEEQEPENEPDLQPASRKQRVRILSAGVMANFVTAFIAFILFFIVIGSIAPVSNVMIVEVEQGSPADNAGLTDKTLITHINDKQIENASVFYNIIDAVDPGNSIKMQIKKEGTIQEVVFTPDLDSKAPISGVMFEEVIPEMPAQKAGMKEGMIITKIDNTSIPDTQAFFNFMLNTTQDQEIIICTLFANEEINYTINLTSDPSGMNKGFIGMSDFSTVVISKPMGLLVGEYPAKELLQLLQKIPSLMTTPWGWIILLVLPFPNPFIGSFPGFSGTLVQFYEPIGWAVSLGGGIFWIANSLLWIGWLNFYIGLFNCLPMLPLDGGHVFKDTVHSILERLLGDKKRTGEIAGQIATGFAILMLASIILMIIAPSLGGII
jgi:membrane-associated protease RseP (regulator of RpoE activity)